MNFRVDRRADVTGIDVQTEEKILKTFKTWKI